MEDRSLFGDTDTKISTRVSKIAGHFYELTFPIQAPLGFYVNSEGYSANELAQEARNQYGENMFV